MEEVYNDEVCFRYIYFSVVVLSVQWFGKNNLGCVARSTFVPNM